MLTETQRASYQANGYLLLSGLVDTDSLERYNHRFIEFVEGAATPVSEMKLMQDVMVAKGAVTPHTPLHAINKLLNFEDDPELYEYVRHPALLAPVVELLGSHELYSIVTNVFNKPPGVDGRHPLHQDLRYFRLRPPESIVATWTAILPSTRRTGCLAVIPGSHKGPLLKHANPDWEYVNFAFYGVEAPNLEERVHIEMEPGDTLFFHPLLIHGSGRNRDTVFRRSISTHYARADCVSAGEDWRSSSRVRRLQ
ncbi:MAG TPA: phytanoyl-CoA dioxygenase family protein [Pseudomonadales bacterium]|jgi:phytanoyl-CoA hydroxylase|nr:phytanoyl-CoA dioxygenase family protein [Pseudomonadales bacterium]|tara:strand:+ start:776 stop:1534 length:759 start_codon:yes stop_codon:yes gene_type:complete